LYWLPAATTANEHKPDNDEPLPKKEDREGPDVAKGKRVRVAEKLELNGITYFRIVRPASGWIEMSECEELPEASRNDQENRAMGDTSTFLRVLKEFDIKTLQDMSDKMDLNIDFIGVAVDRIVEKLMKFTKHAYPEKAVHMAAMKTARQCVETLEQCFKAIADHRKEVLTDLLGLPPPPPPKIREPKKKKGGEGGAGAQVAQLEKVVEKLQKKLDKKSETLNSKTQDYDSLLEKFTTSQALSGSLSKSLAPATSSMSSISVNLQDGELDGEWFSKDDRSMRKGRIKGTQLVWSPSGNSSTLESFGGVVQLLAGGKMFSGVGIDRNTLEWSDGDVWVRYPDV
jgi:hypothetical protein